MLLKKILILVLLILFSFSSSANTLSSTGQYKNWESFTVEAEQRTICCAQTWTTKRAPSSIQVILSKLIITFWYSD